MFHNIARMVELVDTPGSNPGVFGRVGSTPTTGTNSLVVDTITIYNGSLP